MDKRLSLLVLGAMVLLTGRAGAQQWDYAKRQQIEAAVAGLTDPMAVEILPGGVGGVMSAVGLTWAAKPVLPDVATQAFVPDAGAVVELVDIRLLLTQIAIQSGARDHVALVRAQGDRRHDVILLRGGFATLSDLVRLSKDTPAQDFMIQTPEGVVLTRPLAIWADAGLTLGEADHLTLDRSFGSFVVNLGWLDLDKGMISGNATANVAEPAFRPFVLTAGMGSFTATDASFRALGFGDAVAFGGIVVVNSGLATARFAPVIASSVLDDVSTVGLIGTTGAILSNNDIRAATGTAMLVSDARDTIVTANRLTALSGPQGIRVSAGSGNVQISGNLLSGAARIGILVDRESRDVTIDGNLVSGNLTAGISADSASCAMIVGNLVAANGGNGISLTDVDRATISNNAILFNEGSGVLLRDQTATALVRLADNVLLGNREGFRGATTGQVAIEGNDLTGQLPRVFAGDLGRLTVEWLRNPGRFVLTPDPIAATGHCRNEGTN